MKVLQITAVDFTLNKFLLPLINEMEKKGYEVHTACNTSEISSKLRNEGYIIYHIPFDRNFNIVSHIKNICRLIKLFKKEKYQIIHTHTPVASILARLAAKLAGIPIIIYTAHGFYFHENMKPFVYKCIFALEKIWGKYFTNYLFFQSIEDYDLALNNRFNKPEHLVYIGNGVSLERFNPKSYNRVKIREQMNFLEQDIVIAFVGRLVEEKGIRELLEAFDIIKSNGHQNVKLMLIGGRVQGDRDGVDIDKIIENLSNNTKRDIYTLGLRNDIPDLLAASDIFALPSYREGLPRSIIEAMGMGKPIVATNIRGCREEVFPGKNGYLCELKNSKDLAEKLLLLINAPQKIENYGQTSRNLFLKEFNEEIVLKRQMKVFAEIKNKNK